MTTKSTQSARPADKSSRRRFAATLIAAVLLAGAVPTVASVAGLSPATSAEAGEAGGNGGGP